MADNGKPSLFRTPADPPPVPRTLSYPPWPKWDEIPGNWDEIQGNFDQAGVDRGGKPRLFR